MERTPPLRGQDLVDWSAEHAEGLLAGLTERWKHTVAVARLASHVATDVGIATDALVAAAYLHDIGYSPAVSIANFHPLDGARHLERLGVPDVVVRLVAHHTTADAEAHERSLDAELARFGNPPGDLADVLLYADLHTGPAGEQVTLTERMNDIRGRYEETSPVWKALERSRVHLEAVAVRIEARRAAS